MTPLIHRLTETLFNTLDWHDLIKTNNSYVQCGCCREAARDLDSAWKALMEWE